MDEILKIWEFGVGCEKSHIFKVSLSYNKGVEFVHMAQLFNLTTLKKLNPENFGFFHVPAKIPIFPYLIAGTDPQ